MASTNTSSPLMISVAESSFTFYAATVMLKGLSLGSAFIFLVEAFRLHLGKRNYITLFNMAQILSFVAFQIVVLTFLITPSQNVNCHLRGYLGPIAINSTTVCIWIINWLKINALYRNNKLVRYGTMGLLFAGLGGQFQYIGQTPIVDAFNHCVHVQIPGAETIHLVADIIVRVILAFLFAWEIRSHIAKNSGMWDMGEKLWHIVTCDVRSTFIDTTALCLKLILVMIGIPSVYQSVINHLMDWIKMATAHWFVMDVSKASLVAGATSNTNSHPGTSSIKIAVTSRPGVSEAAMTRTFPQMDMSSLSPQVHSSHNNLVEMAPYRGGTEYPPRNKYLINQ